MDYPRFTFVGHQPTAQHLPAEQDFTFIDGIGRWERGDVHAVTEDVAHFLRMTHVFTELDPADDTPNAPLEWQRSPEIAAPVAPASEAAPIPSEES